MNTTLHSIRTLIPSMFMAATLVISSACAYGQSVVNNQAQSLHTQGTRSISVDHHALDANAIPYLNALNLVDSHIIQLANTEPRKTRQHMLAERQKSFNRPQKDTVNAATQSAQLYHDKVFSFFSAQTRIYDDLDYDGFYRTFSVSFDADVYSPTLQEHARVFAELYLSRNGGPWEHYFTTDNFTINTDSSDDTFAVLSTLDVGYKSDYYDVLIDLYEVGYNDIVATVSSEDLHALYALPLESADRDQYFVSETRSAGSISIYALLLILGTIALRFHHRVGIH